jgi:hypothetical protein
MRPASAIQARIAGGESVFGGVEVERSMLMRTGRRIQPRYFDKVRAKARGAEGPVALCALTAIRARKKRAMAARSAPRMMNAGFGFRGAA